MTDLWGVLWRSRDTSHLMYENCLPLIFRSKRLASDYIKSRYGYISKRADLRSGPHNWRMPIPVRVKVQKLA